MSIQLTRVIILGHSGFIGGKIYRYLKKKDTVELFGFSSSDIDLTDEKDVQKLLDLFNVDTTIIFCSAQKRQLGDNLDSFKRNMLMIDHFCRLIEKNPVSRFDLFQFSRGLWGRCPAR